MGRSVWTVEYIGPKACYPATASTLDLQGYIGLTLREARSYQKRWISGDLLGGGSSIQLLKWSWVIPVPSEFLLTPAVTKVWRTNLPTYGHLTWDRYVLETLASKNYIIIKRAPVGAKKTKTGRHMCWMRTQLLWNNGSKWYPASATVNVFNQA